MRGSESVSLPTHEDSEHFAGKLKVYLVMSTSDTNMEPSTISPELVTCIARVVRKELDRRAGGPY